MPFEQPGVAARRERMQARDNAHYAKQNPSPKTGLDALVERVRNSPGYAERMEKHHAEMRQKELERANQCCHKCGANTGRGWSHTFDCYYRGW